eukprot:scaffold338537_cov17-Prasinocladus_malaysianus.AAC.1
MHVHSNLSFASVRELRFVHRHAKSSRSTTVRTRVRTHSFRTDGYEYSYEYEDCVFSSTSDIVLVLASSDWTLDIEMKRIFYDGDARKF